MALIDKITAVADAIRSKAGTTAPMTFDEMVEAINGLGGGDTGGSQLDALIDRSITEVRSNVTSISNSAFQNCSNLTTADFPVVTSIGNYAFNSCSKLTTVILQSETMVTLSNTNAFTKTPIASGTGYIYVPRELLSDTDSTKDYRQATNWSTYAAQFRTLEDYTVDGTITGELDWDKINAAA